MIARRLTSIAAIAAMQGGAAAAQNTCLTSRREESSTAPSIGPTIEPIRPMPSDHPTPVDRIDVGYSSAAIALDPICPPTTQTPVAKTRPVCTIKEDPAMPIKKTHAAAPA